MPTTSTSTDQGHDESMGGETTSVDPEPPGPSAVTADNEKATQTSSSCCDCASRIQRLEAENKRLTEELLAQQRAAVYYNENCVKLQGKLKRSKFTANNLSEKGLKYFTGMCFGFPLS